MIKKIVSMILFFTLVIHSKEWSSIHKKFFTDTNTSEQLVFEKTKIAPFTHIILSWNALRPAAGYFTFEVQAHNTQTNQWTPLYKAIEWGHQKQLSFHNNAVTKDRHSHYVNIRLEMLNGATADGFRVYCSAAKGADVSLVKMIAVNTLNTQLFAPEIIPKKKYKSIHIKNVPYASQFLIKHPKFSELCSPTATSLLVSFLTNTPQDAVSFAHGAYDAGLQVYGSWPFNTAHAYEQAKGKYWFYVQRLNSWSDLYKKLTQKIPVVVSVRGVLPGAPKAFPGGHLLLIVGYDAKTKRVLCHDSSALFKYYNKDTNSMIYTGSTLLDEKEAIRSYDLNDFITAWEKSFRTAYIAEPA